MVSPIHTHTHKTHTHTRANLDELNPSVQYSVQYWSVQYSHIQCVCICVHERLCVNLTYSSTISSEFKLASRARECVCVYVCMCVCVCVFDLPFCARDRKCVYVCMCVGASRARSHPLTRSLTNRELSHLRIFF